MAACNINSLLESGKCFACLTPGELEIIELQLLCEILAASSGGLGGGGVVCGNYGGNQPTFTPSSGCGNAIDTSNGQVWWYYSGAWN